MLDVHAPHGRVQGFKEFLIHLLTITVGLLIATQIESCVEWRHHVHLANEAREAMRAEIESNLKDLRGAKPSLSAWQSQVDGEMKALKRIQEHPQDPDAQKISLSASTNSINLEDTAWRTAQENGALSYMPYQEAKSLSRIYEAQHDLQTYEEKPGEDAAALYGVVSRLGLSTKGKKITASEAGLLVEPIARLRLHLQIGSALYDECIEYSDAYLSHRQPKESFGSTFKD